MIYISIVACPCTYPTIFALVDLQLKLEINPRRSMYIEFYISWKTTLKLHENHFYISIYGVQKSRFREKGAHLLQSFPLLPLDHVLGIC